ncbi:hypothetical protein ONZ51_g4042 [Trametes cubensis]|uniref:DUF6534 domain-containing protein n=1 Tax=Trametes cubensis TaxID=1111947 RepID=A0AAD7TX04_9APHY|nr:hypothetical protein ONZ51_g4042 [Trametes cubensis]
MSGLTPFLHVFGIPSLGTTLGPIYLGVTMGVMLYGLTIHQAYRYYKHYPEDGFFYPRGIVTLILQVPLFAHVASRTDWYLNTSPRTFETLHTAVWMYLGYRYLVVEAFDIGGILASHWTVSCVFLACIGDEFMLNTDIYQAVTMCTGVMFAIVAGVKAFLIVKQIPDLNRLNWMVSVAYGFSGGSDILLAGILIFTLLRIRKESKVRSTRSVLNTLIIYTINTGLLTSIVSFFAFLFATILPGNFIYAGISIVGSKLYANSVLALLNSRRYLNNRLQDDFSSVNLGGADTIEQMSPAARTHPMLPTPRGRAHDETSTMVWAVRQVSTDISMVSAVSTQANLAATRDREDGQDV